MMNTDTITVTPVTMYDEKTRFYNIIKSRLTCNKQGVFIDISRPGEPPCSYPFPRKNQVSEPRPGILSLYIDEYLTNGKIANYGAALADIWRELGEAYPEEKEEKRGRGRPKNKLSIEESAAIEAIAEFRDWQEEAFNPGAFYARVPYLAGEPEVARKYTGLWYSPGQGKPPMRLLDAALYFVEVTYPHANSKNKPHVGTLRAINRQGRQKTFQFTGDELRERENNKFKNFAKWPQDIPTQNRLLNAMEALYTSDPVTIWHEQFDVMGYLETTGGLVFAIANGVETQDNHFIPNEKAPVIGPDLLSPGNGYMGTSEPLPLDDDIWKLIFEGLTEDDAARIAAKMGAMMYTWFPPGTTERAGMLPFYIETVGASSCGKTPEDNILKSLQGVNFRYDSPPFLTLDDTKASSPARMQIVRHIAYSDDDRKSSPGAGVEPSPGFRSEHAARKRMIGYYADGQGAGTRYYNHATKIASRGEPQGLALGTSNYDHAIYALSTPGLDEDPVEYRACTFVVAPGHEIRSTENSELIFQGRQAIYGTGRAARAWLLRQYNNDITALQTYIQDTGAKARAEMAQVFPYDWYEAKQKNHCQILIWGVLTWLDFLKEAQGEECYLYRKLTEMLPFIMCDRVARAEYIAQLISERDDGGDLGEFVLGAIRLMLDMKRGYLLSQKGEALTEDDFAPRSLAHAGYKLVNTPDDTTFWQFGQESIGWYRKRGQDIIFKPTFFDLLTRIAKEQKYILPAPEDIKQKLLEIGMFQTVVTKVAGKTNARYCSLAFERLGYGDSEFIDIEEEAEKQALYEAVDASRGTVIDIATRAPAQAQPPAQASTPAQVVNGKKPAPRSRPGVDPFDIDLDLLSNVDPMA